MNHLITRIIVNKNKPFSISSHFFTTILPHGYLSPQYRPLALYLQSHCPHSFLYTSYLSIACYLTPPKDIQFNFISPFNPSYTIGKELGSGVMGRVYTLLHSNKKKKKNTRLLLPELAVKIIPKDKILSRQDYKAIEQEAKIMHVLGGTLHVVHFYGAYEDEENVYFVLERCTGGTIEERLRNTTPTTTNNKNHLEMAPIYMYDILYVVHQCHAASIAHLDIKMDNFLFADEQQGSPLKLTDFGGSAFVENKNTCSGLCGTPMYTPPEVLSSFSSHYNGHAVDCWSCGVLLYKLLTKVFPFQDDLLLNESIQYQTIDFDSKTRWSDVDEKAKELVKGLLERDVDKRMSIEEALNHEWIRSRTRRSHKDSVWNDGTLLQRLQSFSHFNGFQHAGKSRAV